MAKTAREYSENNRDYVMG